MHMHPRHKHNHNTQNLRRQLVDVRLDVLKHAKKNHVVDTSPNKNDGQAFVHARLGHGHRGFADFFRFTKKDALRASLAGVEWVSLQHVRDHLIPALLYSGS